MAGSGGTAVVWSTADMSEAIIALGNKVDTTFATDASVTAAVAAHAVAPLATAVHKWKAVKHVLVVGGAAGNFVVTGIAVADHLDAVLHLVDAGHVDDITDLTAEFTISAADTINNTAGTASTNGKLLVVYTDLT